MHYLGQPLIFSPADNFILMRDFRAVHIADHDAAAILGTIEIKDSLSAMWMSVDEKWVYLLTEDGKINRHRMGKWGQDLLDHVDEMHLPKVHKLPDSGGEAPVK